ncbi:LysR family transcriptional regulator [Bradyrhizobium sp. 6(2017)]|uniref:LysR family transcriptional regulator n=1 Tax=Bradyrhizobium sp. 6(2017) TaxID=1197460 RepID=UPI0013E11541|nr:LysR family transcriptional regulator [Bradyrhizobium sp. 6(2017)]QIG97669.1 LysR family transcriptional regulator [Bradyrhizobium sp. 6(2017)]
MRGSDFAQLQAFAEVVSQGSFTRAAEKLRMAPSTLSQTIRSLEERLGVTLLHRTTRRVSLTGAGVRLLDRFGPAMAEMEEAVQDARDQRVRPRGLVRMRVPRPAYQGFVRQALNRIAEALPDIVLDLTVDDGLGSFADGFDIIVRRGESADSDMNEVPLGGELRHVVLAAPAYLAANGRPGIPTDLLEHRCINWRRPNTHECAPWCFDMDGRRVALTVSGPITASHCDVAIAAAVAGVGIAYVLEPLATRPLGEGSLERLLESFLPRLEGWRLCHPRLRRTPAAVLAVIETLSAT